MSNERKQKLIEAIASDLTLTASCQKDLQRLSNASLAEIQAEIRNLKQVQPQIPSQEKINEEISVEVRANG